MKLSSFALALIVALSSTVDAFVPAASITPTRSKTSSTEVHLFDIFNEGKKKLVKSLAGDYDEAAIKARVDGLIADKVLDGMNAKYTVVELDTDPDGKAIRAEMADFVGRTSVPAIWIEGRFVGGCNDGPMGGIIKLNESGELTGLLKAAGAL
ncbi:unnamed protein product [Cylindrotheca closterium]|uniref:Glutaredoxin domain-containing protein n=1 Tax=Cylindrotheca closterium TaxID=2856 RepID=A0AAD2FUP9_9STRA|nr:unnamed protein product [Cylindrotheca closterium]